MPALAEIEAAEPSEADRSLLLRLSVGTESGQGTSGMIYPVLNALDGGRYVVKKIPAVFQGGQPLHDGAFLEEVRLHRLCSAECGAIVRYAFACESADTLLVLMEACDVALWDALAGKSNWTAIAPASEYCTSPGGRPSGRPTDFERCAWSNDLCRAVDHCHSLLVLHRDVNPWNIFLVRQSWSDCSTDADAAEARFFVRLGDFGLAVQLANNSEELEGCEACGQAVALDESALGSLYSAPELGKRYGFAADVFSVGMTIFATWNAPRCRDEDALIDTVVAAKEAVLAAKDVSSETGVPSLLSMSSLRRVPLQLNECIVRMLHPNAASRPSAADSCKTVRQSLVCHNIKTPQEAISRVAHSIKREYQHSVGDGLEKVPRQFLQGLISELMHCNEDEALTLLLAAETELGWKSEDVHVDYRQFLSWVFQS